MLQERVIEVFKLNELSTNSMEISLSPYLKHSSSERDITVAEVLVFTLKLVYIHICEDNDYSNCTEIG